MSNTQYLNTNAGFYYTPSGGTTWQTFPLAVPLREPRPSYRAVQYVADSLDLSRRQVFTVSSTASSFTGAQEFVGVLRYNDDQTGLMSFLVDASLQSGSSSYPLRYTTALTTGTTSGGMGSGADCWLIEPSPATLDVLMDRQRASFGDLEVTVRLRAYPASQVFTTGSGARWF